MGGAWRLLTGQSAAEALGRGWLERVHREDRPTVSDAFARACVDRAGFELRCRLLSPDGHGRRVVLVGAPSLGGPDDGVVGFTGSVIAAPDDAEDAPGALGRAGWPAPAARGTGPDAGFASAADHLMAADAFLEAEGATTAMFAVRLALHEVGRALADRARVPPWA